MDYKKMYEKWCSDPYFDQMTKEELVSIRGNEDEIRDRF